MAALNQGPIGFPWEMALQAQQEKNRNFRNMLGDITGIGTGLGQIGLDIQENQKQKKMADFMKQFQAALMGQGSQPAPMPMLAGPGGGIPGGPTQNFTPQQPMSQSGGMMPQAPPQPMGQSDLGRFAGLAQGAGLKDNPFMEQFAKTMNPSQETMYQKASLEEKAKEAEVNQQIKISSQAMQADIAAGRHADALAKLAELKEAIRERMMASKRMAYQKSLSESAKHWFPWTKTPISQDPDASGGGLSPQENAELRALDAKYGGR